MILLIDVKKFNATYSDFPAKVEVSFNSSDVHTSSEDLEHLLTFIKEVYPREQIITELKNLGMMED